jgi:uncharacterized surface protein with fasciclin (FAS1) repeats
MHIDIRWSVLAAVVTYAVACTPSDNQAGRAEAAPAAASVGQSGVKDDESQKDVIKIAMASADHSTLVAAVKAAGLVDVLSNAGPFTVFAPTNAAFDQLPKGTVEDLLRKENIAKLQQILRHHVTTSALETHELADGALAMADGTNATISRAGGDVMIDGAKIIASVRGANGMVHVIDKVILPGGK